MQEVETSATVPQEGERCCLQCQKSQPLLAFSRLKRKTDAWKNICYACEQSNQQERHSRVAIHRGVLQQQREREERRQQAWERRVALRQTYEQCQREREDWYRQQPDRHCRSCLQLLPAGAFGAISSVNGPALQTRCTICHARWYECQQQACCLCQQKVLRRDFLSSYAGYALCGYGTCISLCCQRCETTFSRLSSPRQRQLIHVCCQRTFPPGQVIYAEVDPETEEIRYLGRTGNPRRRHAQHLDDITPTEGQWGAERRAWYTRSNWMYALVEKGLEPSMHISTIERSPLVVEWEQRFIWHGIQQGWRLLNVETMDDGLTARVRASSLNFLQVSFEQLVQQGFFSSHGLAAFLRMWSHPNLFTR